MGMVHLKQESESGIQKWQEMILEDSRRWRKRG